MTEKDAEPIEVYDLEEIIRENMRPSAGYKIVNEIFIKTVDKFKLGAKYSEPTWRLFSAKTEFKGRSDIVFDENRYVNPKRPHDFSVGKINDEDIKRIANEIEPGYQKDLEKVLFSRVRKPEKYNGDPLVMQTLLESSNAVVKTIGRVVDPNCITQFDWYDFIDSLVAYKCKKDERVMLFLKKDLLRGIESRLNPLGLCGKPPGTGMGEFYFRLCLHLGSKVTKKSFLGYALSPMEIYPGTIDGQDLTIAVEQVESNDIPDIFGYLYSIVEQGTDYVSSGAVRFPVSSLSKFTFLSNIRDVENPEKDFAYTLDQIATNASAFLKRISNILYNPSLKRATPYTDDFTGWVERGSFFRGIEELAMPSLRRWFRDNRLWKWCQEPIGDYAKQIKDIATGLDDAKLKYALLEHGKPPHPRLKGAGLNVRFAEVLDEVALSHTLDLKTDILKPAEKYTYEFISQNISSLNVITKTWDEQKELMVSAMYKMVLPDYLQMIIQTVRHYVKDHTFDLPDEIPIDALNEYYCPVPTHKSYPYLSSATLQLKGDRGRKSLQRYNHYLREYFGFILVKKEDDMLFVMFIEPSRIR